jgi:hypothetical protein
MGSGRSRATPGLQLWPRSNSAPSGHARALGNARRGIWRRRRHVCGNVAPFRGLGDISTTSRAQALWNSEGRGDLNEILRLIAQAPPDQRSPALRKLRALIHESPGRGGAWRGAPLTPQAGRRADFRCSAAQDRVGVERFTRPAWSTAGAPSLKWSARPGQKRTPRCAGLAEPESMVHNVLAQRHIVPRIAPGSLLRRWSDAGSRRPEHGHRAGAQRRNSQLHSAATHSQRLI